MKGIFIFLFLFSCSFLLSQKLNDKSIYIKYDSKTDKHFAKPNQPNYFKIFVNKNKYVDFNYGTQNGIKKNQKVPKKFSDINELNRIIESDNPSKKINFIIVKYENKKYTYYFTDYIFRTIECE